MNRPDSPRIRATIDRNSLSQRVAEAINTMISENRMEKGERLPSEEALSKTLGVSKTVIREAIARLASLGIVEVKHGNGVFVAEFGALLVVPTPFQMKLNAATLGEVLEIREIFEVSNVRIAASRATESDIARLYVLAESILDEGISAEEMAVRDVDFHQLIALTTQNQTLYNLMGSIQGLLMATRAENLRSAEFQQRAYREHRRIVDALKARNADQASAEMIAHLDYVRRKLVESGGNIGF